MLTCSTFRIAPARYDIARKLHVTVSDIQEVADFIRTNLTPYPGRQFRPSWQSQSQAARRACGRML